jgi:uncharacterized protein YydD (DUF2326 family)
MLAEIYCDKFLDQGVERGIIKLRPGLNAVVGSEKATNSIGKSTFLLIVDFCFGGTDYARSGGDVLRNVGEHSICFTHVFDGVAYRFSRSITDAEAIWICSEEYAAEEEISRDEFNEFLAASYGMSGLGGGFRGLLGCFMRVYGRPCRDVNRPLSNHEGSGMAEELDRLAKLYGQYARIREMKDSAKRAAEEKSSYLNALKHQFISAASSKADVKSNEGKIADLEVARDEIISQSKNNLADVDSVVAGRIAKLKRELSAVRRHRTRLMSRLDEMDDDLASSKFKASKDIERLREFFPGTDIRRIEEIERFHNQLAAVLKKEHVEAREEIEAQVALLNSSVENLEEQIRAIAPETNVTVAVLDSYADIMQEIERLHDANEAYEKKADLSKKASALSAQSRAFTKEVLCEVQEKINMRLADINSAVCGDSKTAPHLNIKSANSYIYSVENDSGTGAETRGMFLFDVVVSEQTPIPVFIHDSCDVKQVEDDVMVRLFELYDSLDVQVFIATDKAETYTPHGIPDVLKKGTVLKLGSGHELFGRSWNEKEKGGEGIN